MAILEIDLGGTPQPGLVLGYGGIATAKIDEGLRRLRTCFERMR